MTTDPPVRSSITDGLSSEEVRDRQNEFGFNELPDSRSKSVWAVLKNLISEPMIGLLLLCAVIYIFIGEMTDAVLLSLSVLVIIGITFRQEVRSERALAALRTLSSPRALVIRDGQSQRIPARELVPDDLIRISEGDRVPADANLVSGTFLQVNESLLTGESMPVPKHPSEKQKAHLLSGSLVVSGEGYARVTLTGENSLIGRIGRRLGDSEDRETRLSKETGVLVRRMASFGIFISLLVIFAHGLYRENWIQGVLAGIATAIALLPEEFPVVLSIFQALGAWRLSKENVLVRNGSAIENLGSVSSLFVDKTGTLTLNQMTVTELRDLTGRQTWRPGDFLPEDLHALVEFGALASHKDPFDPMEQAILETLQKELKGTEHIHLDWTLEKEYPLSKELMAMSCVWAAPSLPNAVVAAKGAPEAVADLCHMNQEELQKLHDQITVMSARGERVLGVAKADFNKAQLPQNQHDFDFSFVGLIGFMDPVRKGARVAVRTCLEAGVKVRMMTGDHPLTASTIAAQVGLPNPDQVLTGQQLAQMSDFELKSALPSTFVFARVLPEQKLRIVALMKDLGEIVGMTGDGVNDAPSLRSADIGIAMGKRGTDVAREASDIVLLDDNIESLVSGLRSGREIFDNIKKALFYIISIHVPLAGLAVLPVIFGLPIFLFPLHIVFLEFIIDPACSLVFEKSPSDPLVLKRPPRSREARLFARKDLIRSFVQGSIVLGFCFGLFAITYGSTQDEKLSRSLSFISLVVCNVGLIALDSGFRSSKNLISFRLSQRFWVLAALVFASVLLIFWIDPLREAFQMSVLDVNGLVTATLVAVAALALCLVFQTEKLAHCVRKLSCAPR